MRFQITDSGDHIADYGGRVWPKIIVINKKRLAVLEKCRLPDGKFKVQCVLESFGFNPKAVNMSIIVKHRYEALELKEMVLMFNGRGRGTLELKEGQEITFFLDEDWCYRHQDIDEGDEDTYYLLKYEGYEVYKDYESYYYDSYY